MSISEAITDEEHEIAQVAKVYGAEPSSKASKSIVFHIFLS